MTRRMGGWLLILGILALVIGGVLWSKANTDAHKHDETAALGQYLFGNDAPRTRPDHTTSIVLFVGGGGLALFGMLILVSTADTRRG